MPAYSIDTSVVDLPLPSNPECVVQMKRVALHGDRAAAEKAMLKVSMDASGAGISDVEWSAFITTLICRLVVNWNLTDAEGVPLPITAASIDLLTQEDGAFLTAEAQKRIGGRPAAAEVPFVNHSPVSSSADTSREQILTRS